jgi:hypothetical protein
MPDTTNTGTGTVRSHHSYLPRSGQHEIRIDEIVIVLSEEQYEALQHLVAPDDDIDCEEVTRIVVLSSVDGRRFEALGITIDNFELQDDDRTLKIFTSPHEDGNAIITGYIDGLRRSLREAVERHQGVRQ